MAKCKCLKPNCFYCVYDVDIIKMPKQKKPKKKKTVKVREKCSRQLNAWCDGKPAYCKNLKACKCHGCGTNLCKSCAETLRGEKVCISCYDHYTTPTYPEFP